MALLSSRRIFTLMTCSLLCWSSCSTTAEFSQKRQLYPDRKIARPFTPPNGLNQWKMLFMIQPDERSENWEYPLLFYPLIWEQALSDKLQMIWSPFPLDFRLGVLHTEKGFLGMGLSLISPITKRAKDFTWRPTFTVHGRYRLSATWAIESENLFQAEVRTQSRGKNSYVLQQRLGMLWQVNDRNAFSPYFTASAEKGDPSGHYLGRTPSVDRDLWYWRLPIGLDWHHVFDPQWELSTEIQYAGIGYQGQFRYVLGRFWLSYFWD